MTNCDICYAGRPVLVYPTTDYITGDSFKIWRCPSCGAGQTRPVPADLGKYYPAQYRDYNPIIGRILEILYLRRVLRWTKLFKAAGRVFEMGCGNGVMLNMLRARGWQATGSERDEAAARIARERFNLTIIAGGLDAIDPTARFDLILLIQVLEHLADPHESLAKLANMLAPGGKLIIGVPNFASWQSGFAGAGWFHLDAPRHLRHYTSGSLTKLLATHDLAIETISYESPEHDPYGWVQSLLNKFSRRPNRLTRLLMRIDPPGFKNLLHLAAGSLIGAAAVPLSLISWLAGSGALIEITCVRQPTPAATNPPHPPAPPAA